MDLPILLSLGLDGPQTLNALNGTIGRPPTRPHDVVQAVDRLTREELATYPHNDETAP